MTDIDRRRVQFGGRLRVLRDERGLSGRDLADLLGWPPSKISKLETGRQLATDSDVTAWCQAADAPDQVAAELLDALVDLRVEYATWRRKLASGYRDRQEEAATDEQAAKRIRAVDFGVVPGLVQIPDYARRVLHLHADLQGLDTDIEAAVAARMARQTVLYDTTKTIEILVAEAGLRYPVAPPDVMAAQLDRLASLIGMSSIRFGVLPLDRAMPYMPMHGYWLLDDVALVEHITAEVRIVDADEVAIYHKLTDRLWNVAAEGEDARAILAATAGALRVPGA
ncbi:helix-turn-helix transcriptional regulator [Amycolatopsis minnesotensis]|uniref:Helix-turn-helix transcriptional regulator n=1 Tax=Amycolatopsis minnesotensis TaxID=337894 RepID=A0ABN2Q5C5_9PSEU